MNIRANMFQGQPRRINNGLANDFLAFSAIGDVSATGINSLQNTKAKAHIGSNDTPVTGFNPEVYRIFSTNAYTAKIAAFLPELIARVRAVPTTDGIHAPSFVDAEVLPPGAYETAGAASFAGTVFLDGQGDSNSVFIFKVGGALTFAAATHLVCINKALPSNVYFVIVGAFSAGAGSDILGNIISDAGAIALGATCTLNGRLLTRSGAVTIGDGCSVRST